MTTRSDALNDAHQRFQNSTYFDAPGFAFHGAMGAEALSTLHQNGLIAGWVEAYKAMHQPLPAPPCQSPVDPDDEPSWRSALRDESRISDWATMFRRQLDEQPWQEVLRRWLPALLPGYGGAFTHGLIRTAHGARAMPAAEVPSPLLIDELAKGLALWAATYTTLPGQPTLRGTRVLPEAIARIPRPSPPWTMFEAGSFSRLGELDGFAAAVEALGAPRAVGDALSDFTAMFCRLILAHADDPVQPLVHAVTPTAAMRILLPYLPGLTTEALYAQLWKVNAAMVAGFTTRPTPVEALTSSRGAAADDVEVPTMDEVVVRAVEHGDTHAIKFAEACAREHSLRPDPAYPLAAAHVLERMPAWSTVNR